MWEPRTQNHAMCGDRGLCFSETEGAGNSSLEGLMGNQGDKTGLGQPRREPGLLCRQPGGDGSGAGKQPEGWES